MYIKVNKRYGEKVRGQRLQFSVIESYRENGKVKHRTLAYLTSIPEKSLISPQWCKDFLTECETKLKNFPDADKLKLMTRLKTYAPRADEAGEEDFSDRMARHMMRW
ncbi:MAG: hypothetical protein ACR2L1_03535 [Pyrinomonadaceae bacterium]